MGHIRRPKTLLFENARYSAKCPNKLWQTQRDNCPPRSANCVSANFLSANKLSLTLGTEAFNPARCDLSLLVIKYTLRGGIAINCKMWYLKLHEQEIIAKCNCTILYVNNCNCNYFLVTIRISEFDNKSCKKNQLVRYQFRCRAASLNEFTEGHDPQWNVLKN